MPIDPTKTDTGPENGTGAQLYRHFNSQGELIYVGVSLSAVNRLAQHKRHARWFRDISKVTIEQFDCRQKALEAEKLAIREEDPKCNVQFKKSEFEKQEEARRAELEKQRLINRIVRLDVTYTCRQVGDLLGLGETQVKREIEAGRLRCVVKKRNNGLWRRVSGWHLIDYLEENGYM